MKKSILFCLTLLLALAVTAQAQKKTEKEITVKGEVVDLACYVMGGSKGDEHKACAEACAKAGGSLGILTADGKLYVSLLPDDHKKGPNAILMDHIAHMVEATGYVRTSGGVQGIMIKSVAMAKMDKM